ncbi:MAG: PglZ domain-containing protein [Flavobacteriaceae bacterium TMED120]|nr:MAG: PglZ domain-containing protein [Flavobacteriaceae bacterium TMED120]
MSTIDILWVDDEIDLLKPHIIFLENKGYKVHPCNNGQEALIRVQEQSFEVVLLDENMPGLNGLETLGQLKQIIPHVPVVMITKNEEEHIMEEAIGSKISDYLIKPVNPNQILLCLKKLLQHKNLVAEKTIQNYQQEFRKIALTLNELHTHNEWADFYEKMVFWEQELEQLEDPSMFEIFEMQMKEANQLFAKFIEHNYEDWLKKTLPAPTLSHNLLDREVFPRLKSKQPTLLIVIDNLRWDQWKGIAQHIGDYYALTEEKKYFSIIPTATQYARNAIFSGLTPLEMSKTHPEWWRNDTDEGGKNLYEKEFLKAQLQRKNIALAWSYHKIRNLLEGKQLVKTFQNHTQEQLTVIVYNFVDMISHAKTEMEIIKELAADNKAYRSLTKSWFANSPLLEIIQKAASHKFNLLLTTDHGTVNVGSPSSLIGDRETSQNLRYKTGRDLTYESKDVMACQAPEELQLPRLALNSQFVFAKEDNYFVYPKNYNHFAKLFQNSFQHGGISMEEMIIPFVVMSPKS